jgi:hypothetical protein
VRSTDPRDNSAPAIVRANAVAVQMDIDRAAQRARCIAGVRTRSGRVDAERAGRALQCLQRPGVLASGHKRGQDLQVTQLRHAGQQIGGQQYAQPGDVRLPSRLRHVHGCPQHARAGRPDLSVGTGAGIQQAKHTVQASQPGTAGRAGVTEQGSLRGERSGGHLLNAGACRVAGRRQVVDREAALQALGSPHAADDLPGGDLQGKGNAGSRNCRVVAVSRPLLSAAGLPGALAEGEGME